jgi:toxin ParE1/3/4
MPRATRTPEAFADLAEIWAYIAADNEPAADRFLAKLQTECDKLGEFPGMGPARPELAKDLRSYPIGNYIIFYRPITGGVEIIRVLHGARRAKTIFREA